MPMKIAILAWGRRKRRDIQTKAAAAGIAIEMQRLGRFLSNPANIEMVPVSDFAGRADDNTIYIIDKLGENGRHYIMALAVKRAATDTEF